jgi:hypothetical protein
VRCLPLLTRLCSAVAYVPVCSPVRRRPCARDLRSGPSPLGPASAVCSASSKRPRLTLSALQRLSLLARSVPSVADTPPPVLMTGPRFTLNHCSASAVASSTVSAPLPPHGAFTFRTSLVRMERCPSPLSAARACACAQRLRRTVCFCDQCCVVCSARRCELGRGGALCAVNCSRNALTSNR